MIVSRQTVAVCVATLSVAAALAGCTSSGSGAKAPSDTPVSATTMTTSAGPGSPPSPAAPSIPATPDFPTNASGCHDNKDWQAEDRQAWLEELASRDPLGRRGGAVDLSGPDPVHFGGPLCRPERIHIQYWLVHAKSGSTFVDLESVSDTDVRTTGDKAQTLPVPDRITDRNTACDGMLLAVYAGEPLTNAELPDKFTATAVVGHRLFPDGRVALDAYTEPTDTANCP